MFSSFLLLHRPMHMALNERSSWLIEMNVRKTLQSSGFTFIVLNIVEKAALHFLFVMLDYTKSALRNKQLLTSNEENLKFWWLMSYIINMQVFPLNPFRSTAEFYIETCHLICIGNQMTGFYVKRNMGLKWNKRKFKISKIRLNSLNSRHWLNKICAFNKTVG